NEISCFRLDGSLQLLVVAPTINDINGAGGTDGNDDYWKMPKGNLDVTGEYFVWTANAGTNRMDAYIVRVPQDKLVGGAAPAQQQVVSSGYVQLTMSEADTLRFLGLTTESSGTDAGDLKYALRLQAGRAEVRESGTYRTEIPVGSGDTLRISVSGGSVEYSKN